MEHKFASVYFTHKVKFQLEMCYFFSCLMTRLLKGPEISDVTQVDISGRMRESSSRSRSSSRYFLTRGHGAGLRHSLHQRFPSVGAE